MGEHDHARELMLKHIAEELQRANEAAGILDTPEEASRLLEEIERRCVGRHRGELIFCDPSEQSGFLEGGLLA